jgi:hypothetical protein
MLMVVMVKSVVVILMMIYIKDKIMINKDNNKLIIVTMK